jgi:uncharacterized protein YqhQ
MSWNSLIIPTIRPNFMSGTLPFEIPSVFLECFCKLFIFHRNNYIYICTCQMGAYMPLDTLLEML